MLDEKKILKNNELLHNKMIYDDNNFVNDMFNTLNKNEKTRKIIIIVVKLMMKNGGILWIYMNQSGKKLLKKIVKF